ncbi:MAG: ABC transporter ATP-binding protein [Candidatus Cloacimonetes bacterium]|nr:ABC transporter ATP-binding protein [Candidatus Cloacimonadota bacterium]
MLEVKNLKKSFKESTGRLEVLKGINLIISKGDTIAITGESGSGKSTLLHLLGLLDKPDSGEISYLEKIINSKQKYIHKFRNEKIGFVFQFHYLLNDFTAEENIALPMFLKTSNLKLSKKKAGELMNLLDILPRKDHYPNQLSGGEQQRVAVARAMINDPEIIFADEPTGNLDEFHSDELINIFQRLNLEKNQTFMIITHNNKIADQMKIKLKLENGILLLAE